ncbi:PIG-L family deacetylase [Pseudomaricurvus alkylphenolicus]|uniref:PIG-L deacetylase family protein n=1 Tax=Pseudomaricurvus alkylphenolicus TaxID=1306991 RepID=UPI00141FEBD0|nr:PIG-L deacetylase family protein [Pseudomaricurvus alkylphenolicus]NIB43233.1 PIG-L family deacetylase [Pseudomaricurvus alkylphenolicus]
MKKVLVVAAHPDDEALGCGASIALLAAQGVEVETMFLTDGESSRDSVSSKSVSKRRKSAQASAAVLGIKKLHWENFPDNKMDSIALLDLAKSVEKVIAEFRPDTVFTHHGGDLNVDHRKVHQAVMTACRPQPEQSVRKILTFEVASSTEWASSAMPVFRPNFYQNIESSLETKLLALKCYADELREFPHVRSLESIQAQCRRRGCEVGYPAAEAFMVERWLSG